jgi:hypothetical protein
MTAIVLILMAFYFLGWPGGIFVLVLVTLVATAGQDDVPPPHNGNEPNTDDPGSRDWFNDFLRNRRRAVPQ